MPKYLPGARVSRMFGDGRWYDGTVLEARRRGRVDAARAADLEGGPTGPETLRYHMMQTRRSSYRCHFRFSYMYGFLYV